MTFCRMAADCLDGLRRWRSLVKPLGLYMARVFDGERNILTPIIGPVERLFTPSRASIAGKEQGWLGYTLAMLAFSIAGFVVALC